MRGFSSTPVLIERTLLVKIAEQEPGGDKGIILCFQLAL